VNQLFFLKFIFRSLSAAFLLLFCWGCQSTAKKVAGPQDAVLIESKAQIRNSGETNTVQIEVILLPQRAIRMEISGTLGVSVASVVLTPQNISYLLHGQKQYASGPFHEKTLYPIFKKNIDPLVFWRVLHRQSPATGVMKCENNAEQKPIACNSQDGTLVKWLYEGDKTRRIDISSDHFEMSWVFKSEKIFNSYQNETFVLKKPQSYTEIIIK